MTLLLGIDAGTTSVKSGLFRPDGTCIAVARQEYQLSTPRPSWAELDPQVYWQACLSTLREVLSQAAGEPVVAISVSSQGETLIALDAQGQPVYPAIVWLDNRADEEAQLLAGKFSAEVYERSGIPEIIPTWTACKILWLKNRQPEVFARSEKFLLVQDYIIYRLTGVFSTNDSVACTSMLYDLNAGGWWDEVLQEIGISQAQLPQLIRTGEPVGTVSLLAAAETGLPTSALVVGGGMDQSVGAIGAGNIRPGIISETTGAALTIQVSIPSADVDKNKVIPVYCHSVPGQFLFVPVCPTAGMAYKWFRDTFAEQEIAQAEREGVDSYDLVSELAAKAPAGCDGLVLLPHLMGAYSPQPNPLARGSFTGFTLSHTRAHFARAVLEGVAFLLRRNLDVLQGSGALTGEGHSAEIRSTGGGARSALWRQIKADVCAMPVVTLENEETALIGNAILAGVAAGVFGSIGEGCQRMVRLSDKITPGPDMAAYQQAYACYYDLDVTLNDYYLKPGRYG